MPERKVIIVNKGHHFYDDARRYGRFVFLTEGKENIFAIDNLQAEIEGAIDQYAREGDYLLLSGHIIPNCIAFNYLAKKYGKVNMLAWIGNQSQYKVITFFDRPAQNATEHRT